MIKSASFFFLSSHTHSFSLSLTRQSLPLLSSFSSFSSFSLSFFPPLPLSFLPLSGFLCSFFPLFLPFFPPKPDFVTWLGNSGSRCSSVLPHFQCNRIGVQCGRLRSLDATAGRDDTAKCPRYQELKWNSLRARVHQPHDPVRSRRRNWHLGCQGGASWDVSCWNDAGVSWWVWMACCSL